MNVVRIVGPEPVAAPVAERILRELPQWFGIEAALLEYAGDAQRYANFVAMLDDEAIGFVTLRPHNAATLELHCLAVSARSHRAGLGTRLCRAAERWWKARGGTLIQVKTLGESHPDPHYAKSRAFYRSLGFLPVEEFPDLWPGLPCLLLVKRCGSAAPPESERERQPCISMKPAAPSATQRLFRVALAGDLPEIVRMLSDDPLGAKRETYASPLPASYHAAFEAIDRDPNNELVVAELGGKVVGVLQLTYVPSITYRGSWRALIEGVRIDSTQRSAGLGRQLITWAIERARSRRCVMVQLTSDKSRPDAIRFYEALGFEASHEGLKLHLTSRAEP